MRDSSAPHRMTGLFRHVHRADFGDKPFVVEQASTLTYGALDEMIRRTAGLLSEIGAGIGDRIVICSQWDVEVIGLYLAAMRVGVTPALIDPHASAEEVRVLVKAARSKALFADAEVLAVQGLAQCVLPGGRLVPMASMGPYAGKRLPLPALSSRLSTYPALLVSHDPGSLPDTVPDDAGAFILFTSGTTSRPKGVEASHEAVRAHMATMHRQYGYDEHSRIINGLPLHHSDGINHGAVNLMACGGTLYRTGAFSVPNLPNILQMIKRHGITHMITVPTVLALVARLGPAFDDAFKTPSFKFISSTAGPLEEGLWRGFEERFGVMLVNSYGLTETICEGFYCGPSSQTRRIGTIGKPIDIDVRIVDARGDDVAEGEMGELVLRGTCVMKGYFDAPAETAAVLRDGWLYSGDLAVRDADGFYSITGRKKNVVISGGVNVYPEDVTRTIIGMSGVHDAVTVGVPDPTWGERVVSCVVVDGGAVDAEGVIAHCRRHLAKEKVPAHVFILDALPRGPAGKVALPQVREIVTARMAEVRNSPTSRQGVREADLTKRVLALAAASFKSAPADLSLDSEPETTTGWNSLAHMDFMLSLESEFGVKLSPDDMLSIVTLGDAVHCVRQAMASTAF